jgi:hypothetical protein
LVFFNQTLRGKYSAFGTYNQDQFASPHRVITADNGVRRKPVVSEQPRAWAGRRVSLWRHVNEGGTLNSKDDALCVFTGTLKEIKDDSETGWTHVYVESILDEIKDAVLGDNFLEATLVGGLRLKTGQTFEFQDYNGATYLDATDLTVVASGASGSNEVNAGVYTLEEIASILNAWFLGEVTAARIHGNYTLNSPEDDSGVAKTVMHFYIPGAANATVKWRITWPNVGWGSAALGAENIPGEWFEDGKAATAYARKGNGSPKMGSIFAWDPIPFTMRANIRISAGIFHDQYRTLPGGIRSQLPANGGGYKWGLFLIETEQPIMVVGSVSADGTLIEHVWVVDSPVAPHALKGIDALVSMAVTLGAEPPKIRQVFLHEGTFGDIMKMVAYSTGTIGYNHATYDRLPPGQCLGIPYDMLGDNFDATVDLLPRAGDTILVTIEKPKKFAELFAGDLTLRSAHLIWREGGLRWCHWSTPSSATASTTLDQSNKAEPASAGSEANHRTASVLDSSWVKNIVKLNYDRDITKIGEGGASTYRSAPFVLVDATSIDDQGGKASTFTINCDNVYSDYDGLGQGISELAAGKLAWLPYFSRPIWKITRSISPDLYEGFGVGEIVLVTDPFVRDPTTGQRGIVARPGLVVRHRYDLGGAVAGKPHEKPRDMQGEVDIVFLGSDRTFAYVPCAEIDETYSSGGFTAGYDGMSLLRFHAHKHSSTSSTVDVGSFATGDRVRVVEVDPTDLAAPDNWDTEITNVTSGSNECEIADTLTGFDSAKRYRMVFSDYATTVTAQKTKSFQAGTNGRIANVASPAQYGIQSQSFFVLTFGLHDHTTVPELPANISYGPGTGSGRDTGYDQELALLLDNLMDHKTARSSPFLDNTISSNTSYDGYRLLRIRPIFLGDMLMGARGRYLYIRPFWRSQGSGGATVDVSLRVTLSGYLPTGTSLDDVTIKAPGAGNIWTVQSTATGWHHGEEQGYPLLNLNFHQWGYLIIEGTQWANTRGLSMVSERERIAL